ncbi:MAG: hypothetical protein JW864_04580 [Spirochaetes bacterium]|nr:hypothetical protein [Spirochaetota bacterium]
MFEFLFITTICLFGVSFFLCVFSSVLKNNTCSSTAKYLFIAAVVLFIISGIYRFYSHFSMNFIEISSSIWGYFYLFSLLLLGIFYTFLKGWSGNFNSFIGIISPFIITIMLISVPFMNSSRKIILDPESAGIFFYILPVHIIVSIIAEIFFFFSFAGSILYLILDWQLRKKTSMKLIYQLPSLETIKNFNKWSISKSLIFISFGIISGIIMTFITYKTFFMGSAKEFHIYFSWLVIFCVFCIRRDLKIASRKISIINIILFILIMFLFIFTNIFIKEGFHSFI